MQHNINCQNRGVIYRPILNNTSNLYHAGRYDEAVEWGEKAAKYGLGIPNAHRNKASAYFHRADKQTQDPADYEKAVEGYTETIQLLPNWSHPWHDRGLALVRLQRYHEAEANLVRSAQLGGFSISDVHLLMKCWEELGDYDNLMRGQEAINRLAPPSPQLTWARARVQATLGLFDAAETSFLNALEMDPALEGAHVTLAELYLVEGEVKKFDQHMVEAIQLIKQTMEDKPEGERPYDFIASIQDMRGLRDEEVKWNEKKLAVDPDNAHTMHNLAWTYVTNPDEEFRNIPKARQYIDKALDLIERPSPSTLDTRACIAAHEGDFDEAIRWQNKAMEQVPNHVRHRHLLRRSLYERKQTFVEEPGPSRERRMPATVPPEIVNVNEFAAVKATPSAAKLTAEQVAELQRDTTVIVKSPYGQDINGDERFGYSTGMILDPSGYVLTHCNPLPYVGAVKVIYHVPGEGKRDDRHRVATAEVITLDRFRGLALLKFDPQAELAHVHLDLDAKLAEGDEVASLGTASSDQEANDLMPLQAVVSNPSEYVLYRNLIQTSEAFEPGFIGSPLFNQQGAVIGLVCKAGMPERGYAIGMSDVARFLGIDSVDLTANP